MSLVNQIGEVNFNEGIQNYADRRYVMLSTKFQEYKRIGTHRFYQLRPHSIFVCIYIFPMQTNMTCYHLKMKTFLQISSQQMHFEMSITKMMTATRHRKSINMWRLYHGNLTWIEPCNHLHKFWITKQKLKKHTYLQISSRNHLH